MKDYSHTIGKYVCIDDESGDCVWAKIEDIGRVGPDEDEKQVLVVTGRMCCFDGKVFRVEGKTTIHCDRITDDCIVDGIDSQKMMLDAMDQDNALVTAQVLGALLTGGGYVKKMARRRIDRVGEGKSSAGYTSQKLADAAGRAVCADKTEDVLDDAKES